MFICYAALLLTDYLCSDCVLYGVLLEIVCLGELCCCVFLVVLEVA